MTGDDERAVRPGRRRRSLDGEERALWQHVTRSVRRLRPEPVVQLPAAAVEPEPAPAVPAKAVPVRSAVPAKPPSPPRPPPLAPLEPKARRRLARGEAVDARLDLHGLTQAVAHHRLRAFLHGAQGSGHSLVLVITGKGDPETRMLAGEGGRGVLRRLVPQWLAAPELRALVIGFETAARGHGGEGALYVRIRRRRGV
ncbi:Smr/MutS family protein [Ancylobacter terrae]|uniref:Smr/MutS family protein n=1 Tax=Ancylobacter sp. sgz301288 TaxID=3342077 RepID=UPI00385E666A